MAPVTQYRRRKRKPHQAWLKHDVAAHRRRNGGKQYQRESISERNDRHCRQSAAIAWRQKENRASVAPAESSRKPDLAYKANNAIFSRQASAKKYQYKAKACSGIIAEIFVTGGETLACEKQSAHGE